MRPLQAHRRADEQREQPDGRQHVIHRAALRRGRQRHFDHLLRAEAGEGVGQARAGSGGVLVFDDVGLRLNRGAVDGEQEVAALDSGAGAGRPGGHLDGGEAFGARAPENAVLNLVPFGVGGDVRDAESGEKNDDGERKNRSAPHPPAGFGRLRPRRRELGLAPHPKYMKTGDFFTVEEVKF